MKVKLKATFIIFKGLSATKNYVCERERETERDFRNFTIRASGPSFFMLFFRKLIFHDLIITLIQLTMPSERLLNIFICCTKQRNLDLNLVELMESFQCLV